MLRQLSLFLIILLCLSSCQQRYGHVKRVKGDKNKSVHKENPFPEKEAETLAIIPADTLQEAKLPPEIPGNEPKEKAAVPETNPGPNPEKYGPQEELRQLRPLKDLFSNHADDDPNDEPLTFGEKVLILCVFYFWFNLFLFFASIPFGIAAFIILFADLGVILVASPLVVPVLLGLAAVLLVLAIFFSFKVGKKSINKKLGRDFKWEDLIGYFLLALFISILPYALFYLTPILGISALGIFAQVLIYLLFLFAVLYIIWWK